jgi:hypothetical protein
MPVSTITSTPSNQITQLQQNKHIIIILCEQVVASMVENKVSQTKKT